MAIAIRSELTGTGTGNGSNQVTVIKPGTVSNGDYLVVIMGADDDAPEIAPPGGWTKADINASSVGNDRQICICYKKITNAGGEPSSYTFTLGSGDNGAWWIGSLSGVDGTTPEDEPFSGNSTTRVNDSSPVTNTITTATNNSFVLAGWATNYAIGTTLPGSPWAARADDKAIGNISLNVVSQTLASYGNIDAELLDGISTEETSCGIWAFRPVSVVTYTRTANLDTLLKKVSTSGNLLDSYLTKIGLQSSNLDSTLYRLGTRSVLVNSLLSKLGLTGDSTLDALLEKLGVPDVVSIDTLLSLGLQDDLVLDAVLYEVAGGEVTMDLLLDTILQNVGLTRSSTINSILQSIGTSQTINLDSLLVKAYTKAFPFYAYLQKEIPIDLSIDTLLSITKLAVSHLDTLVYKTGQEVVSIDSLLSALKSININLDSLLLKADNTQTISIDSLLLKLGLSTTFSVDALLFRSGIVVNTLLDALLIGGKGQTVSIDSILQKYGITIVPVFDAILQKGAITRSLLLDTILSISMERDIYLDTLLVKEAKETLSIDSILSILETEGLSLDAVLYEITSTELFSKLDALLLKLDIQREVQIGSLLVVLGLTRAMVLDALTIVLKSSTVTLDTFLMKTSTGNIFIDSLLRRELKRTPTLDAILYEVGEVFIDVSIDGLLQKLGLSTIVSVDSLLQKTGVMVSVNLDAIIVKTGKVSPSIDSILQKSGLIVVVNLDSLIYIVKSMETMLDAGLSREQVYSTSIDTVLLKTIVENLYMDAYLLKADVGQQVPIDAWLYRLQQASLSLDAWLEGISTLLPMELDALLTSVGKSQLTYIDSLLTKGYVREVSLDTIVYGVLLRPVSMDTIFSVEERVGSLLDAVLYLALLYATPKYQFYVNSKGGLQVGERGPFYVSSRGNLQVEELSVFKVRERGFRFIW